MFKKLLDKQGSSIIQAPAIILIALMATMAFIQISPAFIAKQQLDTFATELCREAQLAGRVGTETEDKTKQLIDATGLSPKIEWNTHGKVQLGQEVNVTLSIEKNIGSSFFGDVFVPISAYHEGKSERYWKK